MDPNIFVLLRLETKILMFAFPVKISLYDKNSEPEVNIL